MTTVAALLGRTVRDLGIAQAFGLVGSGNFDLSNALVESGVPFVTARHELGAVVMADAYSKVTGSPSVVTLHQGCGLTNAMTGIGEAAKSRTPVLVLAADTAGAAVGSNFRIDQDALVRSVGAVAERVHTPESAARDIRRAYRRAVEGRRTVVVSIATDVQGQPAPEPPAHAPAAALSRRPRPDGAAVAAMADLLAKATRPVIIAGRGARGCRDDLERLGDLTGALLATTAVSKGLFHGSPWSLDVCGGFSSPSTAEEMSNADLVLAMGAALNMWTTRHGRLIDDAATVIQVDIDVEAIGAHQSVELGVVGDVGETARALAEELQRRGHVPHGRGEEVARRIAEGAWSRQDHDDAGGAGTIDPRVLSRSLDQMLPDERTVAVDSGHFLGWPSRYLRVPDESAFVFSQAFQSVGLGLASAIGAAVARPGRLTVAALGDGGALMGLSELETVARLGLDMVIVVYNDQAYGAEAHHFGPEGKPVGLVSFPDTDFAALARAVGLDAVTVRRPDDLSALGRWLDAGGRGGYLVDAKITGTVVANWLSEAFHAH
jgi:thiamine pyrophosphate-dependent acetolactate synthase large subunit-like protein